MQESSVTLQNVQDIYPAPVVENPYAGEPYWVLQAAARVLALQLLRHVPDGPYQQQALLELRRAVDTALLAVPIPPDDEIRRRLARTLAPYGQTPRGVVAKMLTLARVTHRDVLYDLGSGDGRIPIAAAQRYNCRSIGIEIDPLLVAQAQDAARDESVADLVSFKCADLREADFSEATVITAYLLTSSMQELAPRLRALKPGTRIVSHGFEIDGWPPDLTMCVTVSGHTHRLLLWKVRH